MVLLLVLLWGLQTLVLREGLVTKGLVGRERIVEIRTAACVRGAGKGIVDVVGRRHDGDGSVVRIDEIGCYTLDTGGWRRGVGEVG